MDARMAVLVWPYYGVVNDKMDGYIDDGLPKLTTLWLFLCGVVECYLLLVKLTDWSLIESDESYNRRVSLEKSTASFDSPFSNQTFIHFPIFIISS